MLLFSAIFLKGLFESACESMDYVTSYLPYVCHGIGASSLKGEREKGECVKGVHLFEAPL